MFLLYYKQGCPYSQGAETLMNNLNVKYVKFIVNNNIDNIKQMLYKKYNHNTFPTIFYRNEKSDNSDELRSSLLTPATKVAECNTEILDTDIFIGGFDKFNQLLDICKSIKKSKNDNFKKLFNSIENEFKLLYRDFLIVVNYIITFLK
jgi:glutaredoxin